MPTSKQDVRKKWDAITQLEWPATSHNRVTGAVLGLGKILNSKALVGLFAVGHFIAASRSVKTWVRAFVYEPDLTLQHWFRVSLIGCRLETAGPRMWHTRVAEFKAGCPVEALSFGAKLVSASLYGWT